MWVCWLHILKWSCWDKTQSVTNHPMSTYYVSCTGVTRQKMSFPQGQDKDFVRIFHFNRCCHNADHLWFRRSQAFLLSPHIILGTDWGASPFTGVHEATPPHFAHAHPLQIWTHQQQWLVVGLGRQGILDHSGQPMWKMQAQALAGYRDRAHRLVPGSHSQAMKLMDRILQ